MKDLRTEYYWTKVREYGKKYKKFDWPSVEVLLNFLHTYDLLSTKFSKAIHRYGLSLSAFNVMMILSRSKNGQLKQQEVSELLLVSRANVTGLVDGLVKKGFVARIDDRSDRRVCLVKMMKKGEDLLEKILPGHYQAIADVLKVLDNREKQVLNTLLTKIKNYSFQVDI